MYSHHHSHGFVLLLVFVYCSNNSKNFYFVSQALTLNLSVSFFNSLPSKTALIEFL
ncbi:MAG: hypothetical protein ACM3PR_10935 [Bacteroidales bacterium]